MLPDKAGIVSGRANRRSHVLKHQPPPFSNKTRIKNLCTDPYSTLSLSGRRRNNLMSQCRISALLLRIYHPLAPPSGAWSTIEIAEQPSADYLIHLSRKKDQSKPSRIGLLACCVLSTMPSQHMRTIMRLVRLERPKKAARSFFERLEAPLEWGGILAFF